MTDPELPINGHGRLPARFRKTVWARLHYVSWNLVLFVCRPVSIILRGIERRFQRD